MLPICGLLLSCEHKPEVQPTQETTKKQESSIVFSDLLPEQGAVFNHFEAVVIQAELEWDQTLHGYEVYLKNLTNGDTVFQVAQHVHGLKLTVEEEWINEVEHDANMQLDFVARTSHEGESVVKSIYFRCKGKE